MSATRSDRLRALALVLAAEAGRKVLTTSAAKAVAAKAAAAAGTSLAALAPVAGPAAALVVVASVIVREVQAVNEGREAFRRCQETAAAHAVSLAAPQGRARAVHISELPTHTWEQCWRPSWLGDRKPGRAAIRTGGGWVRRDVFSEAITGRPSALARAALGRDLRPGELLVLPYGGLYTLSSGDAPLGRDVNYAGHGAWPAYLEAKRGVAAPEEVRRVALAALELARSRPNGPERDGLLALATGLGSLVS